MMRFADEIKIETCHVFVLRYSNFNKENVHEKIPFLF